MSPVPPVFDAWPVDPSQRPWIMGILNVTPDSFSDGGRYDTPDHAAACAVRMVEEGAQVIDIGGESTRPGSRPVPAEEQLRRVLPVIQRLTRESVLGTRGVHLSIDTPLPEVARAAMDAGVRILNDISAGRGRSTRSEEADSGMFELAARGGCGVVLMHMRGEPASMQVSPRYDDVVGEVVSFLLRRAEAAERAGVPRPRIALDPGFGFGKTLDHNLALLGSIDRLVRTGYAVVIGVSRKRMFSELHHRLTGRELAPTDRLPAACAASDLAVRLGVRILRVHDTAAHRQAADLAWCTRMPDIGRASGPGT